MSEDIVCPCGTEFEYRNCCLPFHQNTAAPPSAEQLMRSRYSAFVVENEAYLLQTWHATTRPSNIEFDNDAKWLGLKISECSKGSDQDFEGWVKFVARYKIGGKAHRIAENSYFVKVDEKWVYLRAE